MDAFSTAAGATALVGTCAYIARSLANIRKKFKRMHLTIDALSAECFLLSMTFSQVAAMIKRDPASFDARVTQLGNDNDNDEPEPLAAGLKSAIDCATMLMATLQETLDKCVTTPKSGAASWTSKASFLWNEDDLKESLEVVGRLSYRIGTLLTAMQSSDLYETLKANTEALQVLARQTKNSYAASIKDSNAHSTVSSTAESTSYFEEELIMSPVYRNAFRSGFHKLRKQRARDDNGSKFITMLTNGRAGSFSGVSWTRAASVFPGLLGRQWDNATLPNSRFDMDHLKPILPKLPDKSSEGISKSLLDAVKHKDVDEVKRLLDQGADIEASDDERGFPPLHLAAKVRHNALLKVLLGRCANQAAITDDGDTALHLACIAGDVKAVKMLLNAGSEILARNNESFTALHHAARYGNSSIIRLLLRNGADVEAESTDSWKSRPLHAAAFHGHQRAVEMLIREGNALVKSPSAVFVSPLSVAVSGGNLAVVEALSKAGAPIDSADSEGLFPIHWTTDANDSRSMFTYLLKQGADCSVRTKEGMSVLHLAACHGNAEILEYMLNTARSKIDECDQYSWQAIHFAAANGQLEIMKLLKERGAHLGVLTASDLTLLHMASRAGQRLVVEYLLDLGADLESETQKGYSALSYAAKGRRYDVIKTLIDRGANVNHQSMSGWTPLHYAAENGDVQIVHLLVAAGARIDIASKYDNLPIHEAIIKSQFSTLRALLDLGADVNCGGHQSRKPIHFAAELGNPLLLAFLLERGALFNATTDNDETPLHYAARSERIDNIRLLLNAGADLHRQCRKKFQPLHLAIVKGHFGTTRWLLDNGANINAVTDFGSTVMHLACAHGQADLIELLFLYKAKLDLGDADGRRPLHVTCLRTAKNPIACAVHLSNLGADIDARDRGYDTSLHIAAKNGNVEMVRLLVGQGSDMSKMNLDGETALDCAIAENNTECSEFLEVSGCKRGNPRLTRSLKTKSDVSDDGIVLVGPSLKETDRLWSISD